MDFLRQIQENRKPRKNSEKKGLVLIRTDSETFLEALKNLKKRSGVGANNIRTNQPDLLYYLLGTNN